LVFSIQCAGRREKEKRDGEKRREGSGLSEVVFEAWERIADLGEKCDLGRLRGISGDGFARLSEGLAREDIVLLENGFAKLFGVHDAGERDERAGTGLTCGFQALFAKLEGPQDWPLDHDGDLLKGNGLLDPQQFTKEEAPSGNGGRIC
jgi:hypothetical protein